MSLESRLGVTPRSVPRDRVEVAPQELRLLTKEHLSRKLGKKSALDMIGGYVDQDTSDINSPDWVDSHLSQFFGQLDWVDVYRLLEEQFDTKNPAAYQSKVNDILARRGVAYEMVRGKFQRWDPTGSAFELEQTGTDAAERLVGRFAPAREQYLRAVHALESIPGDPKAAAREAVNALEAVLKIISGKTRASMKEAIGELVQDPSRPWLTALGSSLKALYGYSSEFPGVRHGQYRDGEASDAEAALVVRMCGAAIVYFVDEHGS